MGQTRKDRPAEDWLNYGDKLLALLKRNKKLHNDVEGLIQALKESETTEDRDDIASILNEQKYELGKNWTRWVTKITQAKKDKNRARFYLDEVTYKGILTFLSLDTTTKDRKKTSDNNIFKNLLSALNVMGVDNINELYQLLTELDKFNDGLLERNSREKLTDIKKYQGRTTGIIHAILDELKHKNIRNFEKLKSIRREIRNEKIDTLVKENQQLHERIEKLEKSANQ